MYHSLKTEATETTCGSTFLISKFNKEKVSNLCKKFFFKFSKNSMVLEVRLLKLCMYSVFKNSSKT